MRDLCSANSIQTTEGGYALGAIISDAEEFLETGDTRLWRGAYLEGLSLDRSSETVRETLHLALQNRAEILLETDPLEATRIGRLLGNADPYDLEHLRLMLRALRAAGNHKSLNRTYERARERSLEVGQVLPETWAGFLEQTTGEIA